MMKSYLRFEPKKSFGVISSPQCNVIYDFTGNLAFTGAVQDVCVWNLRQASQIETLSCEQNNYPFKVASEVTILERSPDNSTIAAGYADGEVRIFNYINKSLVAKFHGHRSGITSLCFSSDGTVLATGGADCDIILWDLISQTGVCKLRGHKDAVTGLNFISRNSQKMVVSVSKDTLMKVWDVETRSCLQTIVGHRCEIWSMAVLTPPVEPGTTEIDDLKLRIVTGSSDEFIRGYRFKKSTKNDGIYLSEDEEVLEYYGCVVRGNATDKCTGLYFNYQRNLLGVQCSGKAVELFRVRNDAEAKKKLKRRQKRMREKNTKATGGDATAVAATEEQEGAEAAGVVVSNEVTLQDELELLHTIRCAARIRGLSFSPAPASSSSSGSVIRLMVGLITNTLEVYTVPLPSSRGGVDEEVTPEPPAKLSVIDMHGHRSDVRGVCVSGDGLNLATCSSEGVKTWSTKSHLCLTTAAVEGYCVTLSYAPGGRYVVVGTKEGHVLIIDSATGESVFDEAAHEGSVWSIAVRPDGKGFMTGGADKLVKFWDFSVTKQGLGASMSRHLVMAHDVLSLRYSPSRSQDRLLVAVGLLDNTIKLFYDDSLKFFLSLYGHKLPVMCLDISYDGNILISGSADKTIKIWGLDFGDCHRSLIAHEDSVTAVKFQANTHYFFSSGKDGVIKYWDADRFEQILFFPGHKGSVWSLDLSPEGATLYSVGQDRTIRVWERGEDLVFVEEERERSLEAQVDLAAEKEVLVGAIAEMDNNIATAGGALTPAALKTIESVKGGEGLMDALDLVEAELAAMREFEVNNQALEAEAAAKNKSSSSSSSSSTAVVVKKAKQYNANPQLLGLSPHQYMLRVMRNIKAPDLEQALIILPFHYVARFIPMLVQLAKYPADLELVMNTAVYLVRLHLPQIQNTESLTEEIIQLREVLSTSVIRYRNMIGSNIAALKYAQRVAETKKNEGLLYSEPLPVLGGAEGAPSSGGGKKKRKKAQQQHHD